MFQTFSLDFFVSSHIEVFITSQDVAHTAFNYSSHYFQWQSSNNSELRFTNAEYVDMHFTYGL
jgi:hypothetical protein